MKIKLENAVKLGRPGITYADVKKAIEFLIKKKVEPTLKNIKDILKYGGSTTISQYRAKYYTENGTSKNKSIDYLNGWRDAMKAMKVFIQDNNK